MTDLSAALVAVLGADLLADRARLATLPVESGLVCLANTFTGMDRPGWNEDYVRDVVDARDLVASGTADVGIVVVPIELDASLAGDCVFACVQADQITFDVRTAEGRPVGDACAYALVDGEAVPVIDHDTRALSDVDLRRIAERRHDLLEAWRIARDLPVGVASLALRRAAA